MRWQEGDLSSNLSEHCPRLLQLSWRLWLMTPLHVLTNWLLPHRLLYQKSGMSSWMRKVNTIERLKHEKTFHSHWTPTKSVKLRQEVAARGYSLERLQWNPLKSEFLKNRGRYHKMVLGHHVEGYLSYLLPKFEDLVPTSLGSGAI